MINRLVWKGLVFCIIILFIGVAVQPSVSTVQRNKEIITAVIENKDTLNELIEQLSDVPCDCENDDTTQRNYPIICMLLAPFVALAIMWTFTTYREGFGNIIAKIDDIFNCNFLPIHHWPL